MTTKIYYPPHPMREQEAKFADALIQNIPDVTHLSVAPPIDPQALEHLVDTKELIRCLSADTLLPPNRKAQSLSKLRRLPEKLKVALSTHRISCDLCIKSDRQIFYFEFHETQHRSLAVSRNSLVYGSNGTPYYVPRFLQRLIRDVWRIKVFRSFTIVWYDWFEEDGLSFEFKPMLGFHEYALPGRFCFTRFCEPYDPTYGTQVSSDVNPASER